MGVPTRPGIISLTSPRLLPLADEAPMRPASPLALAFVLLLTSALSADPLPGTKPLTMKGDLAAQMVSGIDKYLDRELAASVEKRKTFWKPDFSSPEAYEKSVQPNRERLARLIGVVDKRVPVKELTYVETTG